MKIKILFLIAGAILLFQSCATTPTTTISAAATQNQKVGYGDTIVSMKKHFVSFAPYTQLDEAVSNITIAQNKTKFMLTVENCGDDPIRFDYDQIAVVFEPKESETPSEVVGVQSWDDFIEDLDKEYDKSEKQYLYNELYEIQVLSEAEVDVTEKLMDLKFEIEDMRRQNDVLQEMLPAVVMKSQQILAGKSYSGVLICDTSDLDSTVEGNFRIQVTLDGERHNFVFTRGLD